MTPDIDSSINVHLTHGTRFALIFESGGGIGRGFWIRVWRYIAATTGELIPAYKITSLFDDCGFQTIFKKKMPTWNLP